MLMTEALVYTQETSLARDMSQLCPPSFNANSTVLNSEVLVHTHTSTVLLQKATNTSPASVATQSFNQVVRTERA